MGEHVRAGVERVPLVPGRWYAGRSGRDEAVARILSVDPADGKLVVCAVQAGAGWQRLAQRCRSVPLVDFERLLVGIQPERFEPLTVYVAQPMLGLGRRQLPEGDMMARLARVMELHPEAAGEVSGLMRHGEGRPVWLAEAVCAVLGLSLAWVLLGRGPMRDGEAPTHTWGYAVGAGGISRRCQVCGIVDGMTGASSGWCLRREADEIERRAAARVEVLHG